MNLEETKLKIDEKDGKSVCFKFVPAVKTYSGVRFAYWKQITHKEYGEIRAQNALIEAFKAKPQMKREEEDHEDDMNDSLSYLQAGMVKRRR